MKKNAYLIIHGFGGCFKEINYLAEYLINKNLDVYKVLLDGHGYGKVELKKTSYTHWLNSIENSLNILRKDYVNISLIGFSMGGLLAMHFATMPVIDKVVFVNTPIYFWNISIIISDILHDIRNQTFDNLKYYSNSVGKVSLKSSVDFLILLHNSKKILSSINKRSLIIQCKRDESVNYKSAKYINKHIGGESILRIYEGGKHQIFYVPKLRDEVCDDIYDFLL